VLFPAIGSRSVGLRVSLRSGGEQAERVSPDRRFRWTSRRLRGTAPRRKACQRRRLALLRRQRFPSRCSGSRARPERGRVFFFFSRKFGRISSSRRKVTIYAPRLAYTCFTPVTYITEQGRPGDRARSTGSDRALSAGAVMRVGIPPRGREGSSPTRLVSSAARRPVWQFRHPRHPVTFPGALPRARFAAFERQWETAEPTFSRRCTSWLTRPTPGATSRRHGPDSRSSGRSIREAPPDASECGASITT